MIEYILLLNYSRGLNFRLLNFQTGLKVQTFRLVECSIEHSDQFECLTSNIQAIFYVNLSPRVPQWANVLINKQ